MGTIKERIEELEEEIRTTPYNKATQHHIGKLKAKIAKLKEDLEKASGGGGRGYMIKKSGNATVSIVGFPSVGKSTLLNNITEADSEVGSYEFTTLDVIPGMLYYKDAEIQILDLPGLIKGAAKGKGKGRQVLAAARSSDVIALVIDVFSPHLEILLRELWDAKIRINEEPADIKINGRDSGGIDVAFTCEQSAVTREMIEDMTRAYGFVNASVVIRSDIKPYQFIDKLTKGVIYTPGFLIINKTDLVEETFLKGLMQRYEKYRPIATVATKGVGAEKVKERIFEEMKFIRVYLKPQGSKADMEEPLVIKRGSTVKDVCNFIHRDFTRKFRYGRVWGKSGKFPGQKVGLDHPLRDGDILSIIIHR